MAAKNARRRKGEGVGRGVAFFFWGWMEAQFPSWRDAAGD